MQQSDGSFRRHVIAPSPATRAKPSLETACTLDVHLASFSMWFAHPACFALLSLFDVRSLNNCIECDSLGEAEEKDTETWAVCSPLSLGSCEETYSKLPCGNYSIRYRCYHEETTSSDLPEGIPFFSS